MNAFLTELATLGLMVAVLVLGTTLLWTVWRSLQQIFPKAADRQKLVLAFAAGALLVAMLAVFALSVIDQPRRLLFDYVGLLLAVGLGAFVLSLLADLSAGLQLRLRGIVRPGVWLSTGAHAGKVRSRGWLHVTLILADGQLLSLPNRYLTRVPLGSGIAEAAATATALPRREARHAEPAERREPQLDTELESLATHRYEPTLAEMPLENSADASGGAAEVVYEPSFTLGEPEDEAPLRHSLAESDELRLLKRDYTDMSQQLLALEQSLQDAGQGDQRQSLSLEKKKLQARLIRMEKQIAELAAGERRSA